MQDQLDQILNTASSAVNSATDVKSLELLKVQYLGKKGELTELLKQVSSLPKEQRPEMGKAVNIIKRDIATMIATAMATLAAKEAEAKLAAETIDVTMPATAVSSGSIHPVARVRARVEALFKSAGFRVVNGPEIEVEEYNFNKLNIPESHPARAMADTFYLTTGELLRTHTSPVQIRTMEQGALPLRVIAPGRVFRRDSDHTHTPMFHQLEALVIDEQCTFAELKGILHDFIEKFFEMKLALRFRPSYFPFTEPSAEVDIQCTACLGDGCRVCGQSGWLEVLGCGMVHPNVLNGVGIDSAKYSGYAFGVGLDRLAMLRYKIPDLRMLFENDINFLSQF